jgi:DNA repair protein RecO (recombination protein O)
MIQSGKGIILHAIKYGETSIIAHIYTITHGRKTFIITNTRYKKNRSAQLFQPLTMVNFEFYYKETHEIHRIKEIHSLWPYSSIPFEAAKSSIAFFIAEVLYKTLKEEEPNAELFSFLIHSLQTFDAIKQQLSLFHLVFLIKLSAYLGIFPYQNFSETDTIFDMLNGRFTNSFPAHPYYLEQPWSSMFWQIMQTDYNQLSGITISVIQRRTLLENIIQYYQLHFDSLGNLKSYEVLKDLYR